MKIWIWLSLLILTAVASIAVVNVTTGNVVNLRVGTTIPPAGFVLQEDGFYVLQEDGTSKISNE